MAELVTPGTSSTRSAPARRNAKLQSEKKRVKYYHIQLKYEQTKRKLNEYKQKYYRLAEKKHSLSDSPRSKLDRDLKNQALPGNVKRKILFDRAVRLDLKESFSAIKSDKEKQMFTKHLKLNHVKKYRFLSQSKPFFPYDH